MPWIADQLKNRGSRAITILRENSHTKRHLEINDDLITELNGLSETATLEAIEELWKPHFFSKGTNGKKLSLKTTFITTDTQQEFTVGVLIDSGCEGSCINSDFVRRNKLNTNHLPRPI
jgi:hypothetical protein